MASSEVDGIFMKIFQEMQAKTDKLHINFRERKGREGIREREREEKQAYLVAKNLFLGLFIPTTFLRRWLSERASLEIGRRVKEQKKKTPTTTMFICETGCNDWIGFFIERKNVVLALTSHPSLAVIF